MIKVSVFSEDKAWSKRLRNSENFFKKICNAFQRNINFKQKSFIKPITF